MSHNIGVIKSNNNTDSFGKTSENSASTNNSKLNKTSELEQIHIKSDISSKKREADNAWTIDLVKKYMKQ